MHSDWDPDDIFGDSANEGLSTLTRTSSTAPPRRDLLDAIGSADPFLEHGHTAIRGRRRNAGLKKLWVVTASAAVVGVLLAALTVGGSFAAPAQSGTSETTSPPQDSSSAGNVLQAGFESAVYVETDLGSGTGVAISSTEFLTAAHVVADADSIMVNDKQGREFEATVVAFDEQRDLAVLETDIHGYPTVEIRDEPLHIGERVYAVGQPDSFLELTAGEVDNLFRDNGVSMLEADAETDHGSSGGPILDTDGQLVGIVLSGPEEDFTITYGATSVEIIAFLAEQG